MVLEIVTKNYDMPTFVYKVTKLESELILNLDKEAKLIFDGFSTWLSIPYAKSIRREIWPSKWAVSEREPQGVEVYT